MSEVITQTEEKVSQKGRNGKYKRGSSAPKHKPCDFVKATDNDVTYYNKYQSDYETAFSYSWFRIMGTPIPFAKLINSPQIPGNWNDTTRIPSVMSVNFVPCIGVSDDVNSPINRCFNMIMADLYAKTSGSNLGFQAADLGMMLTSTSSIACLLGTARKVLHSTEFWKTKNALYPRALISAMGFSYEDIVRNKPNYVTRLNSLCHMFNNMQIPAFLDIFKRQFALSHNLFVDEDDEFGQVYTFTPQGYYKYIDTEMRCEFTRIPYGAGTFADFLDIIEEALGYWINSTDFYTINGALLRAYKGVDTVAISDASVDGTIELVPPNHILNQIMNMSIVGTCYTLDISQNPAKNQLICKPSCASAALDGSIIRLFTADPTLEEACEATRMTVRTSRIPSAEAVEGLPDRYEILSMQSELVERVTVYTVGSNYENAQAIFGLSSNYMSAIIPEDADTTDATAAAMIARAFIAFAPFRYVPLLLSNVSLSTGITDTGMMGDLYNYTLITADQVENMNRVANLSLWRPQDPSL